MTMTLLPPVTVVKASRTKPAWDTVVKDKVGKFLEKNNATKHDDRYFVETKIGKLIITPYNDWIACYFSGDLEPVRKHFGVYRLYVGCGRLNPYSGKWNFLVHEVMPKEWHPRGGIPSREACSKLADFFISELTKILPE
jgi:hypothetical protein